jgi:ferredoxin
LAITDQRVNGSLRFSVDGGVCIGCGLCHERAPENFGVTEGEFCSSVTRQPINAVEEDACIEAERFCPAGGISQEPGDSSP